MISLRMQGWGCCPPPISNTLKLQVLPGTSNTWTDVNIPKSVKAVVLLNLQSYGGGRNIWGGKLSSGDKERGMHLPKFDDGLFEVRISSAQLNSYGRHKTSIGCTI